MEIPFLLGWLACGIIAAAIGARKGEGFVAFVVGALLGPLGIVFALISNGNRSQCLACREYIDPAATICPRCQTRREATAGADAWLMPIVLLSAVLLLAGVVAVWFFR
jgi:hypothetical protein